MKEAKLAIQLANQFQSAFPGNIRDLRWLCLVRHGKTNHNESGLIAGQLEGEHGAQLTQGAKKSATYYALELRLIGRAIGGFQHQLVSPLPRAQETARLCTAGLSRCPDPVDLEGLKERGMGGLVLQPKELHREFFEDPEAIPPAEGRFSDEHPESFRGFVDRVSECLHSEILPQLRGGNVLVVSHQYTTAAIQMELFGWSLENSQTVGTRIPNCAPLLIGLDPTTLRPAMTGLCVLRR
jgi:broad specificity phosphatase PhoE